MRRKRISKTKKEKAFNIYNGRCAYCGCILSFDETEFDHSTPVKAMQTDDDSLNKFRQDFIESQYNIVPACHDCNSVKNSKSSGEFKLYLENKLMEDLNKNQLYRIAKKFGFVQELHMISDIEFYKDQIEYPED